MMKVKLFLVLFCIIFCLHSLNAQDNLPEIEVTKITNNIYKLYVYNYVNIVAFLGTDGVLLIDSGFNETNEQVKSKLKELGSDDIKYLINTHSDGDHTGGNHLLGKDGAIIAHSICRKKLSKKNAFPKKGLPDITFEDSLQLHFNSEELKLISLTGGHSTEDIIVYFTKANIVCLGDIVIADSFPFVRITEGARIDKLVKNIESLSVKFSENTRFILGHGRDYTLNDLRKYHEMLVTTIKIVSNAMKAGKNTADMKKERILMDWTSWNNKKHTWINTELWIDTICHDLSK